MTEDKPPGTSIWRWNWLSYDQIKADFPKVWAAREADKLNFRYPGARAARLLNLADARSLTRLTLPPFSLTRPLL